MRRLFFIVGGAVLLVLGIAMRSLAPYLGYLGVIVGVFAYLFGALGIISIVLGILGDQKRQ